MSTLIDNAEFSADEVYQIQQTDSVEGAAVGASFSGIGISNQPHQQLANRTAFLRQRQDTNIANIGVLQGFKALFAGSMGQNGYLKFGFQDVSRGLIQAIVQWGFFSMIGATSGSLKNAAWGFSFPIPFPNACETVFTTWVTDNFTGPEALVSGGLQLEVGVATVNGVTVATDWDDHAIINVSNGSTTQGLRGFNWFAIGF